MNDYILCKEIIVPLIATILGFAFPMLIGIVQRIDDKYNSTRLVRRFVCEPWTITFIISLMIALGTLFYLLVAPLNKYDFGWATSYIDNSAIILATLFCITLIVCLFAVVRLIYIYHDPGRLQDHLLNPHSNSPSSIKADTRKVWLELFAAMLEKDNTDVLRDGYQALYEWCISFRKGKAFKPVEYPSELYEGIVMINEKLCFQKKLVVSISNGNDILRIFLDEMQYTIIHHKTFKTIWICLSQQLYYGREEWVMEYWGAAHQYYLFDLSDSYYEGQRLTLNNGKTLVVDHSLEESRRTAQKDFKEFHIALGGLMLYQEKYKLLRNIVNYTSTEPPQYILVPGQFGELFSLFMDLLSFDVGDIVKYEIKYPFLNLKAGARNNNIINGWIQRYLAFLMIRLYALSPDPNPDYSSFRAFPSKLAEKQEWLNNIPILQQRIEDKIVEKAAVEILLLEANEVNSFREKLLHDIIEIKDSLEGCLKQHLNDLQPSGDEITSFFTVLRQTVSAEITPLMDLFFNPMSANYTDYDTAGEVRKIESTEAFADERTISYVNFKETLAHLTVLHFKYNFFRTFMFQKPIKYRVFAENVKDALKRLNLDKEKHIIIGFGVNWYEIYGQPEKTDDYSFVAPNGFKLYSFQGDISLDFMNTIVVLNKSDLPHLDSRKLEDDLKEHYKLQNLNSKYGLYASVIKLNKEKPVFSEVARRGTHSEEKLLKSVLVCTELNIHTMWKNHTPMVMIRVLHQYSDSGNENIDEIQPFR